MSSTKKNDDKKFNDTLKRMLKTPPKPTVKGLKTESSPKQKPGGNPAKNDRPED